MRTIVRSIAAACAVAVGATACQAVVPIDPPDGGDPSVTTTTTVAAGPVRYVDPVFGEVQVSPTVTYGRAPDLVTGAPVALTGELFGPAGDTVEARPAIVWVHGGGFRAGDSGNVHAVASDYARRGYVGFAIDYRLNKQSRCQAIQDGWIDDPAAIETCRTTMQAAQHDTQAAVRWLRANAARLRIDPDRIAVGGFSAGAIAAVNVAQHPDDPGSSGSPGQPSDISAALVATGCSYERVGVGGGDAPISVIAATLDTYVDYEDCVAPTVAAWHGAGLTAELTTYEGESTHAMELYLKYQAQTDADWTRFLVQHLDLA